MKLIKYIVDTRSVEYFGIQLQIPKGFEFVATDEDGQIWAFDAFPKDCSHRWFSSLADCVEIGIVDLEGMDWRETLRHYPVED